MADAGQKKSAKGGKLPRKISERSLENIALHYLKRYAATAGHLKRVLIRRVDRSLHVHPGDRSAALGWIDALVAKLVRNKLVDDDAYAHMKAHSLRLAGRGAWVIEQKLRLKGVSKELARQKVTEVTAEVSEEAAARIWAKKKRLGPFRTKLGEGGLRRMKDLAALARAGFSFGIASKVIDGEADENGC